MEWYGLEWEDYGSSEVVWDEQDWEVVWGQRSDWVTGEVVWGGQRSDWVTDEVDYNHSLLFFWME